MSYVRFSEADVYVYLDCGGWIACCACRLSDNWQHASTDAIVAHLHEHVQVGHDVPQHIFDALEADREENEAFIAGGPYER